MGVVIFIREQKQIEVPDGTTILEAEIQAGLCPDAPCGGQGKCGKCLVKINGEIVKACQTLVHSEMKVDTLISSQKHAILTEGLNRPVAFKPGLFIHPVKLEKAIAGDNRSDWERLVTEVRKTSGLEMTHVEPNLKLAASLFDKRKEGEDWFAIHTRDSILELKKEKPKAYMTAFDIGTTTVVGYLMNAENGTVCAI